MNPNNPLPSDVTATPKIEQLQPTGEDRHGIDDEGSKSFASLMQSKEPAPVDHLAINKTSAVSPFDLANNGAKPIGTPNIDTLMSQTNLAHNTMSTVQTQLSHPDLQLKPSQKYLVKNKLSDVNTNLRAANAKLGIPPSERQEDAISSKGTGPIAQYLGYVSDGLNQLDEAKKQLVQISSQGANISPAEFMLVQLKMNKAQQELDFTSAVLGKSIEGFKMIMNVQI